MGLSKFKFLASLRPSPSPPKRGIILIIYNIVIVVGNQSVFCWKYDSLKILLKHTQSVENEAHILEKPLAIRHREMLQLHRGFDSRPKRRPPGTTSTRKPNAFSFFLLVVEFGKVPNFFS